MIMKHTLIACILYFFLTYEVLGVTTSIVMDKLSTTNISYDDSYLCGICSSLTAETIVKVRSKGKDTLKEISIERGDNLFSSLVDSDTVYVHATCRSHYINRINVEAAKRKAQAKSTTLSPVKRKLRKSLKTNNDVISGTFDWNAHCLICGAEAIVEKQKKYRSERRQAICHVETSGFASNIIKLIHPPSDDFHRNIMERVMREPDLVVLNARYHKSCYTKLIKHREVGKNTKYKDKIEEAMEEIYSFMLSSDECQFTITELMEVIKSYDIIPHEDTIKSHLKNKFSDQIVISSRLGGTTYVCFSKNLYDIFTEVQNNRTIKTVEEQETQLIDSASELLRRKIRNTVCNINEYPASDKMFDDVNKNIPPLLLRFLNNVIYKDKAKNEINKKCYSKKVTAIAHAIVSAARPRSFISPLQLATGATLYRKFGSKHIVELCNQLGFSCSYSEVLLYEMSAARQAKRILLNPFIQIVSDNSDFNISTIDGRGTFHNLGSIEIITPAKSLQERMPIKRFQTTDTPKCSDLVEENRNDLLLYTKKAGSGLKTIIVKSVENELLFNSTLIGQLNILWMYMKYKREGIFPGWNGFMKMLTDCHYDYEISMINFLPFIQGPPSDYSTLYTALKSAAEITLKEGMKTCIITFDQPLYIKARDIVASTNFNESHMVVRLGGFHLLMSFMGCIGQIMAGSGIKDILSIVYAEGSLEKILSGHSYARAVRAHILLQVALSNMIFTELKGENRDFQLLFANDDSFSYTMNIKDIPSDPQFQQLAKIFESKLKDIEQRGKTCKLWVLYFRMVTLLKEFLAAERMGDWKSHLSCIEVMIPFFHAAGHLNYAKSTRLYLQDMKSLEEEMDPVEYKMFTEKGFFTARRTNEFFAGVFTDQTIEQTLMRSMSVEGGPFKRGATESIVLKWIKGIIFTKDIIEGLESFCNLEFNKSHQHVDSRDARIERDKNDILAIVKYLEHHNPFEDIDNLRSIATGLIATDDVNCFDALDIGVQTMMELDGMSFADVKQSRKSKIVSLEGMNSKIKIGDKTIPIDPLLLFQRICVMKKSEEELEYFLKFELAPYPLSLFDEVGMRKTNKSVLYSLFQTVNINLDHGSYQYIIDGGMLLYKVKWPINCTYEDVIKEYVFYLKRNFGNNVVVVFDAYNENSTKASERYRRSMKLSSKDYQFTKDMSVPVSQEKFLSNYKNKSNLITYLLEELPKSSIQCYQGDGEADALIVQIAVGNVFNFPKVVVAEDVDILVILTARAKEMEEIYFLKLGRQNVPSVMYSSKSFALNYPNSSKIILFSHCFTGCDTTSTFYNKGKKKFFNMIEKRPDLVDKVQVFYKKRVEMEQILEAGRYCTAVFYGAPKDVEPNKLLHIDDMKTFLENMRYLQFVKSTAKTTSVKLSSLLPTVDALDEHIKRVYFQIQVWLGNESICPTNWGWVNVGRSLQPTKMTRQPAPQELLKIIFCNCKTTCGSACGCRKHGLFCNLNCRCFSRNCQNCPQPDDHDEDVESDDNDS